MKRMIKHVSLAIGVYVGMVIAGASEHQPMVSKNGLPGTWNTLSAHNLGKGRLGIGIGVQGVPYDASYFKKVAYDKDGNIYDNDGNIDPTNLTELKDSRLTSLEGFLAIAYGINNYVDLGFMLPAYVDAMDGVKTLTYKEKFYGGLGDMELMLKARFKKEISFNEPGMSIGIGIPSPKTFTYLGGQVPHKFYYIQRAKSDEFLDNDVDSVKNFYSSQGFEFKLNYLHTLDFRLMADKERYPVLLHWNLGMNMTADEMHHMKVAFSPEFRPDDKISFFAEANWEPLFKSFTDSDKYPHRSAPIRGVLGMGLLGEGGFQFQAGAIYNFRNDGVTYTLWDKTSDGDIVGKAIVETPAEPALKLFTSLRGLIDFGTEDTDGDGIPDKDDQCPKKAEDMDGFQDNDGCPDVDNDMDGIKDVDDKCPGKDDNLNTKEDLDGFDDEDGCPEGDNDGDGINDMVDRCPRDPEDVDGFEDGDGCPDTDNDMDGVADSLDKCPVEAEDKDGFEDEDGCPDIDNDKDGINDAADRCPNEPENMNGFEDTDGCPDKKAVVKALDLSKPLILRGVNFVSGKATLTDDSYSILDKVIESLRANPDVKIKVVGHTDSVGGARQNQQLSYLRAKSVMRYMVQSGIDQSRLKAEGMGEDDPIASNATAAGRAENRRVELEKF